ncbi:MAG: glycosyltransferase, partial [Candidatus Moranbacteria bacterium]|nr:glycosyltransferase [Candidatus Moranbacteria bacterium]
MNKKKIVIAHVVYSFNDIGGMENGLINILNNLNADLFTHVVCSLTTLGKIKERVAANNVQYIALGKKEGNDPLLPWKLFKVFSRVKADVVHLRNWPTMVEGYVAAKLAQTPKIIYSEHGRHFEDVWQEKKIVTAIHRYILNHVDIAFCVSAAVAYEMHNLYNMTRDVKTIINGVDTEKFRPREKSDAKGIFNFSEDEKIVGTVGRLVSGKNLDQLIVDFLEHCSKGQLIIVGDGPEKETLRNLIASYQGDDRVLLTGHLDNIPKVLNAFDLFVLPSASEGLSNVLLEALSAGLPIIAYDVGGNSELINPDLGGILVPQYDRKLFIDNVSKLLNDSR